MRPFRLLNPQAFTLVEVISSLLLTGTLLVMVLAGHRRAVQQTVAAERRLEAIALLDGFLQGRQAGVSQFQEPVGKLPGKNPCHWRVAVMFSAEADSMGAAITRVEIYNPDYQDGAALATVEVLSPGGGNAGAQQ